MFLSDLIISLQKDLRHVNNKKKILTYPIPVIAAS